MASEQVVEFNDSNFDEDVLSSDMPVVVDFWAEWCGPCKMLTPIIDDLAQEFEGKIKIGKLNVDNNPGTASKYGVSSIPTLLFVKGGNVVDQHTGLLAKDPLKTKLDNLLAA
ncbi:MAG: thioredoxin [Chitinivibrionales bacterium]|nr:thioredoxin [Chitinivibrionales bacterium]